jgi:Uma2 family endonuclease
MTLQVAEPQIKRWTREEYYQLAEEGHFRGQRVQLIDGEIIQMPPMGHGHAKSIVLGTRWLSPFCVSDLILRVQMPLNASKNSDPEPDLAVVPGPLEAYEDHPQTALFIIEVSDSSLPLDRKKANLYAAIGVKEFWIIDIEHRCVEVYRNPQPDPQAPRGFRYAPPIVLLEDDSLAPLLIPAAIVKARDLLP